MATAPNRIVERKVIYPGTYIFREGDVGDRAYIVQEGKVEILKRRADGSEVVLGVVGVGGIFGEMALIDNEPRMAGARAVEATTIAIISREQFVQRLQKSDPFLRGLLKVFVRTIRQLTDNKLDS